MAWHIKIDKEELYLPKMLFNVEEKDNDLFVYPINLTALGKEHPITKRITEELYKFYAQGEAIENLYRQLGIPHQVMISFFQKYPFLSKRYYMEDRLDEVAVEEILEAYQKNELLDLALKHRTTVQKLLKKLLKDLVRKRQYYRSQARVYKTYQLTPNKDKKNVYVYKADNSSKSIKYIGKISSTQEIIAKWQNIRASFLKKLQEYNILIKQIKDDLRKNKLSGAGFGDPAKYGA
ncbi:MAG: hypothetical protein C0170_05815 [Hydrogenobaculum sp.]|nr:MAG: hypothetical protein C0170_05815 [Hydrogenobaculum sp.]